MKSNDIRRIFIEFFDERGHHQMPSSPLVPHNDPTVLLTTAGMQQMTPYFLGLDAPPHSRLTSIQKCFRTVDIDEVGDESHLTFFEMLGNFSVGDYFKPEAISWAWELLTERFGLSPDQLWPTVHHDDDVSFDYWRDEIGIAPDRITRLGDEDNWWGPVSETGPNGPDSEIFFDRGEEHGCGREGCRPGCDCERFLEVWNLVFMEFFKENDGSQRPLPRKNIDTGMGLERIAMVLQGASSIFDTDLYEPIIARAADISGVPYRDDPTTDRSLRVIGDHSRAVTFLISDGVFPGNEGRSYVLRRVLRRAVRHGRLLGITQPFLADIADTVIDQFGEFYPDLIQNRDRIRRIIQHEESHFSGTLATGITRFEEVANQIRERGEKIIPGEDVFRLYDTYGFPYELTDELARDLNLTIDQAGFTRAMEQQRETSRAGRQTRSAGQDGLVDYRSLISEESTFVGYDHSAADTTIQALICDGAAAESVEAGTAGEVVLRETPFYAESGGQVGDTGTIRTDTGIFRVDDTQRPQPGVIVHFGEVSEGFVETGQPAHAHVDVERRIRIQRNHTATHLLHAALRAQLGDHAHQAGSLVAPDRLRFDFTNLDSVDPKTLRSIQDHVNTAIMMDTDVAATVTTYEEAIENGAMALFGEKYGDEVRVISIGDMSAELCGGTHVHRTGEIGPFVILEETSVASGTRRIEALTGDAALQHFNQTHTVTNDLARRLQVTPDALVSHIGSLLERIRESERTIEQLRIQMASGQLDDVLAQRTDIDGTTLIASVIDAPGRDAMLQLGDRIRDKIGSGVIVLGALIDERPAVLAMVTKDLTPEGLHAGNLVRAVAEQMGGRGGGKPELAQGGGAEPDKLESAIASARNFVQAQKASTTG